MRPDWERDGIQLYCADCMDVLPHLSGVDAVVTDPPFGMAFRSNFRTVAHAPIQGDRDDSLLRYAISLEVPHSIHFLPVGQSQRTHKTEVRGYVGKK